MQVIRFDTCFQLNIKSGIIISLTITVPSRVPGRVRNEAASAGRSRLKVAKRRERSWNFILDGCLLSLSKEEIRFRLVGIRSSELVG